MKDIRIVADMAADLFHAGHVNFLRKAKTYFDDTNTFLTVALHTNDQIFSYKGRYPIVNYEFRKQVLLSCKYVDDVIEAPEDFDESFINKYDYLIHGDDLLKWSEDLINKFYKVAKAQNKLLTVPYTEGISTTQLIKKFSIQNT